VAKRNTGRRGRPRKRRPSPPTEGSAQPRERPSERPGERASQRVAGAAADLKALGERPRAPWHPLPLSELLIFVGIIGAIVGWLRGPESNAALLGAGIGAVVIGTVEFSLREHLSGFRSHTLMLSVLPAVLLDAVVLLAVLALAGHAPGWLGYALLPVDVAVVAVSFKLLRARYVDARRERKFARAR